MSKQQFTYRSVLSLWFLGAAVIAVGDAGESKSPSPSQQPNELKRRAQLPAGWFKFEKKPGALTDTKAAGAQPVVYFDTTGDSAGPPQAVKRLQRARDAVLFKDLKSPPQAGVTKADIGSPAVATPAADAPPTSKPSVVTVTPTTASPRSSRRQRSAPSSSTAAKQDQPAESTDDATAQALPTEPPARVERQTVAARPSTSSTTSSTSQAADVIVIDRKANAAAGEPAREAVAETVVAEDDTAQADAASDGTTVQDAGLTVDALPSVMKPTHPLPSPDETERMTLSDKVAGKSRGSDVEASKSIAGIESTGPSADVTVGGTEPTLDDDLLIKNDSPILSVATRGPKTLVVGKAATYEIDLHNRSEVAARNVTVRVNIPSWVEVVQQRPTTGAVHLRPDDSGQSVLAWEIDRLTSRRHEKLMINLIPRGSRPIDLGVTWTFSPARTTTQIQVQEPRLQMSVVGPQDVQYGDTKIYTITVSNPGTGDAENVVLNLLPLVAGERPAGVRNLGTVPAGARRTLEVELTTQQTGRLFVRAEAVADGGLRARAQQEVIVRRAELEVVVEGPPMKYAGTRSRYSVRVSNRGDAAATDVNVAATVPAGAKQIASSDGGNLNPNTGQVQWQVGILRPGASRVLELECTLMSAGDNRVDLRATAAGDLNALAFATTQVESLADLKLTVNDPQGAVAVGADVSYDITITNRGTKEAANIQVFGYFSEGVEPNSVGGWRGQVNEGEVVLQVIPRLAAGQEMTVRIAAQADRPGDHVFRAELECGDPETKLAVEEWTRFYGEPSTPPKQARKPNSTVGKRPLKLQRY